MDKRNIFPTVLEVGSPSSGCLHGWLLVRAFFQVEDCQLPIMSSSGKNQSQGKLFCLFLDGYQSYPLGHHLRDLITSQRSHLLKSLHWGLKFQHINLVRGHIIHYTFISPFAASPLSTFLCSLMSKKNIQQFRMPFCIFGGKGQEVPDFCTFSSHSCIPM